MSKKTVRYFLAVVGLFMLPHSAFAGVTRSYDGCFERPTGVVDQQGVVWMRSVTCTITLTNSSPTNLEYPLTVQNLDPKRYKVTNGNGGEVSVTTKNNTSLQFTALVPGDGSSTYTLTQWDQNNTPNDFYFVNISDPQTQPGEPIPNPIFVEIMSQIETISPAFVTVDGDLLKGDVEDAAKHEEEYLEIDPTWKQFKGTSILVPGDHDGRQSIPDYFGKLYGEQHVAFSYGNTDFFGVNTTEDLETEGEIHPEEWAWLETQLAASTATHKIVYMHHPLVSPAWANSYGLDEDQKLAFANLLVEYDVELLMTGDAHGYEYRTLTGEDINGFTGSIQQLVAGGAGGRIVNYDGTHFFVLLHVSDNGITVQKYDYDSYDVGIEYEGTNDGTEDSVHISVTNDGEEDLPYINLQVYLDPYRDSTVSESRSIPTITQQERQYYATNTEGEFLPFASDIVNGELKGSVTIALEADDATSITVQEARNIRRNIQNTVDLQGYIRFQDLPSIDDTATELQVSAAERQSVLTIDTWDVKTNKREWTEKTAKQSTTTFYINALEDNTQYDLYVNNALEQRLVTDEDGGVNFSFTGSTKQRMYKLIPRSTIIPTNIGILPSSGGPHFQLYGAKANKQSNFFVYDQELVHGYQSIWADVDGDSVLELITVPDAGVAGYVRLFEQTGKLKTGFYPFGSSFIGGIHLTAGDIDGDGDDEIIVTAEQEKKSVVKVYEFDGGVVTKKTAFRVYDPLYTAGLNIATGDIDGDGDDEIIAAAHEEKKVVKVFRWHPKKKQMQLFASKKPYGSSEIVGTSGFVIATGDTNFNGRDEIVLGSQANDSHVQVFSLNKKKRTLVLQQHKRVFGKDYTGGVSLLVANIDSSEQEEIIVAPLRTTDEASRITVYQFTAKKQLKKQYTKKPFGDTITGPLVMTAADIDQDWQLELIVAQPENSGQVRIFEPAKKKLQMREYFTVYDATYTGGLSLTTH